MKQQALTTAALKERIHRKFDGSAIVLFEVRNTTGYAAEQRSADAVVVETWPSRGFAITGIEIKVSRADWLRELKAPAKAECIHQFCDLWFLAVGHADVCQPSELPAGWGLLVPSGGGLKVSVNPSKLEPKPVDRGFLCALVRRARQAGIGDPAVTAALEAVRKETADAAERSKSWNEREHQKLKEKVAAFEAAAGFSIAESWHGPNITGAAVRALIDARDEYSTTAAKLRHLLLTAERTVSALRPIVAELPTETGDEKAA